MNKILIPTDFSANATIAAKYAFELFRNTADSFCILNTYRIPHAGASMLVSIEDILREESVSGLKELQSQFEGMLPADKVIEYESQEGDLATNVHRMERHDKVSMIVMGTTGADKIETRLFGSNTWQVTQKVHTPMIVVTESVELKIPQRILLSTDLSEVDPKSIEPLLNMVKEYGAELLVVHIDTGGPSRGEKHYFRGALDNIPHEFHTIFGDNIVEELNDFARQKDVDLLAMVRRKRGFFEKIFSSSTSKGMALSSSFPLLVLSEES
jgi:nucleotide-binding universal stress UspA family protein